MGWGGLADCFEETSPHYQELKSLLDEDEYAAARASSLTAFLYPPVVIRGIYKALSQMGFQQGNILEPSCGTGNFWGFSRQIWQAAKPTVWSWTVSAAESPSSFTRMPAFP